MIVAIDGPAGSGKSTIARLLAQRLNFLYLDTGAMYRALTLKVLQMNIDLDDYENIIVQAKNTEIEFKDEKVFLDSADVTSDIRLPQVDKSISSIAKIPEVREEMVKIQRSIGCSTDCVVEGRDTTTVVFPDAKLKIFLDARFSQRAKRRLGDFRQKGIDVDIKSLETDLKARDTADMTRAVGPLKKASDCVYVDTTDLTIDEVVSRVYSLAENKLKIK
ncbi:MAG: (d)CMP kinase [Candidatus Omnitrophica bacterium]|nr:(d)CMP kinase [Candidatus Omnitrophota bacterium]